MNTRTLIVFISLDLDLQKTVKTNVYLPEVLNYAVGPSSSHTTNHCQVDN